MRVKNLVLSGPPGVGKTTLIQNLIQELKVNAGGFITSEIREGKERIGFWVRDLEGREAILASVHRKTGPRVGKYRVNLEGFEGIALPALRGAKDRELIVIDEIGKMELFSLEFKNLLLELLDFGPPILATILRAPHPFCDRIKQRKDLRLFWLSQHNQERVYQELITELRNLLSNQNFPS